MHTAAVILGILLTLIFGSALRMAFRAIANTNCALRFDGIDEGVHLDVGVKVLLVAYWAALALGAFLIYWGWIE